MYIPKNNRSELNEAYRFIKENPFAILISLFEGKIIATHIPVELEENEDGNQVIRTHIAKANPQWKNFETIDEIMVIFNGPHTYISSSWYDHQNVPTWNYIAVHVYGKPKILSEKDAIGVLSRLTNRYEKQSEKPFSMDQLEQKFINGHLKALVAFEISIDRIEAKEKLSQNRDLKNYENILQHLQKRDDAQSHEIKNEMERVKRKLFE